MKQNSKQSSDSAVSEGHQAIAWVGEWYALLNQHKPFQEALKKLFLAHVGAEFTCGPLSTSELKYAEILKSSGIKPRVRRPPSRELQSDFESFAAEWQLPERCVHRRGIGLPDLYGSFQLWDPGKEPQIAWYNQQLGHFPCASLVEIHLREQRIVFDFGQHSIAWARRQIDQRIAELRADARSQIATAEALARAQGWCDFPPKHRSAAERKVVLKRAFRYFISGESLKAIARDGHVTQAALKKSLAQVARLLKLQLRKRPAGRPRRK